MLVSKVRPVASAPQFRWWISSDATGKRRNGSCKCVKSTVRGRETTNMTLWQKVRGNLRWQPAYLGQRLLRHHRRKGLLHLIISLADHFEPAIVPRNGKARASWEEQERRLEGWCREYPAVAGDLRDSDDQPFRHTYFYPAEQYDRALIERLAEHCNGRWGEIEVHLHHGREHPDTAENTRRQLLEFRNTLVSHGCLSHMDGNREPRYAFVHGNFALANSAGGDFCGVDSEMQILSETGCYADLTLPSAPHFSQVAKINSLCECALPLNQRSPHRRGRDLRCGRAPMIFPLIVQGPLMINLARRRRGWPTPGIENGALTALNPPTLARLQLWKRAGITVRGRQDWVFIKLHCHGMDPRDHEAMLGTPMRQFLKDLVHGVRRHEYRTHFVTAREMVNMILAACDGREGDPGQYRDYRLRPISSSARDSSCVGPDGLHVRDTSAAPTA